MYIFCSLSIMKYLNLGNCHFISEGMVLDNRVLLYWGLWALPKCDILCANMPSSIIIGVVGKGDRKMLSLFLEYFYFCELTSFVVSYNFACCCFILVICFLTFFGSDLQLIKPFVISRCF